MLQTIKSFFRISIFLLTAIIIACVVAGFFVLKELNSDLPEIKKLSSYQPAGITRMFAADGSLMGEYAVEYRNYTKINQIPQSVIEAFLAAEDKDFFNHPGVDIPGIIRATWHNVFSGGSLQGASTITQQVAKNLLLSPERTIERKLKEMILSYRITQNFSKEHILELYLNEIYFGEGAYGIAMAAENYFNKPIKALSIAEAATLAALPKAPNNYTPRRHPKAAKTRRNHILKAMYKSNFISIEKLNESLKENIRLAPSRAFTASDKENHFSETVRQYLLNNYGYDGLYKEGLQVFTTMDPRIQKWTEQSLRHGLFSYSKRNGYYGIAGHIEFSDQWQSEFTKISPPTGTDYWKLAVINDVSKTGLKITTQQMVEGEIPKDDYSWALKQNSTFAGKFSIGDLILVAETDDPTIFSLRQIPKVEGAAIVISPKSGDVLGVAGGFSYNESEFNRATQAKRQPGSAFKPFVYLAALEAGFTPASLINDEPLELDIWKPGYQDAYYNQEDETKIWSPKNYSGKYYGPTTLRKGVESSLNALTVNLGLLMDQDKVQQTAQNLDIYQKPMKGLAIVLGSQETSLMSVTNAYAILSNGGKFQYPKFLKRIHNKTGKLVERRPGTYCSDCIKKGESTNIYTSTPVVESNFIQATDPASAYQMTSILEGVVQRGTGIRAKAKLKHPIAGKTGTTNNSMDAWFIGYSDKVAVGVFVGFDEPRTLGKKAQGSNVALPIFIDIMQNIETIYPPELFDIPNGIELVEIDKKTGLLPNESIPSATIIEAFKTGSTPTEFFTSHDNLPVINQKNTTDENHDENDIIHGTGGIY